MDELNITIKEDIVDYNIPVWLIFFNGEYQTLTSNYHDALYFIQRAKELYAKGLSNPEFKSTREYRRYFE